MLGFHSQDKDRKRRAQKKQARLIFYAEAHPILSKDSESRVQRQTENEVFKFDYAEAHPILSKDNKSQVQRQTKSYRFFRMTHS